MNVLDLFSGIGGFSLGLERAGHRTVAFCEIDPYCRAVLAKHWPGVPIYDDVTALTAARLAADGIIRPIPDTAVNGRGQGRPGRSNSSGEGQQQPALQGIDAICGGFPCQDISVAGKGAGIEGECSGLWKEYARIIGEVRPRYVIIENVSALLSGSDEYEFPNDRCLCGWPYRWRGMHQHSAQEREGILPANRRGNGPEGVASAGGADGDIWRIDPDNAQTVGEMGRGAGMAALRSAVGEISSGDTSTSAAEASASGICPSVTEDDRLSAQEAEWLGFVDGAGDEGRESNSRSNVRVEPQGTTTAQSISGLVCEACGRDLDYGSTRSGVSTWMGRVLQDLASLGYSAEFHCISASAIGAPHRRDRLWIVAHAAWVQPGRQEQWPQRERTGSGGQSSDVADTEHSGREGWHAYWIGPSSIVPSSWWLTEPDVGRVAHGVPARVDRLRSLGNAIVPQIAEIIGRALPP